MKIYIKKRLGFIACSILMISTFSSCLKDRNKLATDFSKATAIVELPVAGFKALAFDVSTAPVEVNVSVNLAGPSLADKDIQVTLVQDQAGLDDYNTNNGTAYLMLPDSAFSISSLSATIKKGERIGVITVMINTQKIDLSQSYALAYKISDAQGSLISQNFQSIVYAVLVKNSYDGNYFLTLKTVGWAAYGIADGVTYDYGNIGLITSGANSVTLGGGFHPAFTVDGGVTAFGATFAQFTFDPVTNNLIDVDNLAPDDGRGRDFFLNPAITDSRYDPATKTVYAAYIMVQIGRPNQMFYDTLTYVGPR